jgi:hypothetical protein
MTVRLDRTQGGFRLLVEEPRRGDDPERYLEGLEAIGAREEPFVLLISITIPLELPPPLRKAQNLWFKTTRQRLKVVCGEFCKFAERGGHGRLVMFNVT